jgi:hypothetical protein
VGCCNIPPTTTSTTTIVIHIVVNI